MKVVICSVPVETPGGKLRRQRSEGPMPILPKIAISSLNNWAVKNNLPTCNFFDIDMLYPDDKQIEKYFTDIKADIVGLSAVVSTSYMQVKRISRIIKNINKNTLIVCGGYLTAAANTVLRKTNVDICVVGEGEIAWVGILKKIQENIDQGKNKIDKDELLKVKGVALLDENNHLKFSGYGERLSSCDMTFPDFEYLKSGLLGQEDKFLNHFRRFDDHETFQIDPRCWEQGKKLPYAHSIYTSKGCVARCTFCQRGAKGYSTYDLDKLEKYIINLKKYNVGFLYIDDENFGSNRQYTYQIAELMNKHEFLWACSGVRCTSVTRDDLIHYKNNGCVSLKFGIESGSQVMLDIMEKKFTVEDIKTAIFNCYDVGIYSPPLGFMVGMPGESLKTAMDSGKLMGELAAKLNVHIKVLFKNMDLFYAIPLIGTPLYEYGKTLGLIGRTVDEEEEYLNLVSNVGAYKRYYINFNGAPMSEVVFWDILVYLEAVRTFRKITKNQKSKTALFKNLISATDVRKLNPHTGSKSKEQIMLGGFSAQIFGGGGGDEKTHVNFDKYFITNFLKKYVIFNNNLSYLPRIIIYPLIRYLLYLEYLIQKFLLKDVNNIHNKINSKINRSLRIDPKDLDIKTTTQKERSLRYILEKKLKNISKNEQEKTISLLTAGP